MKMWQWIVKTCEEENVSEDTTKAILNVYSSSAQKLRRANEQKEKYGYQVVDMDIWENTTNGFHSCEVEDKSEELEETVLTLLALEELKRCLTELSEFEVCLILACYSPVYGSKSEFARKQGMTAAGVSYHEEKILTKLRALMGVELIGI